MIIPILILLLTQIIYNIYILNNNYDNIDKLSQNIFINIIINIFIILLVLCI